MFIRIKKKNLNTVDDVSLSVVLVKSIREKGLPRQKVIAYLGTIRRSLLEQPAMKREFQGMLYRRIDQVDDLGPLMNAKLKMDVNKILLRGRH